MRKSVFSILQTLVGPYSKPLLRLKVTSHFFWTTLFIYNLFHISFHRCFSKSVMLVEHLHKLEIKIKWSPSCLHEKQTHKQKKMFLLSLEGIQIRRCWWFVSGRERIAATGSLCQGWSIHMTCNKKCKISIYQCRSKGRGQGGPCPPSFFPIK